MFPKLLFSSFSAWFVWLSRATLMNADVGTDESVFLSLSSSWNFNQMKGKINFLKICS